jgi:hypothetical protein
VTGIFLLDEMIAKFHILSFEFRARITKNENGESETDADAGSDARRKKRGESGIGSSYLTGSNLYRLPSTSMVR